MRLNIHTMPEAKHFRCYLDGEDISNDCFAADDKKGIAYCYVRDGERRWRLDKRGNLLTVERRGHVVFRVNNILISDLPFTIVSESTERIINRIRGYNRWGILHPRTWTARLNRSPFLVKLIGFPLYTIGWYLFFDRQYWKDEYPTRRARFLGAVKHAVGNIRSSWRVLVLQMTQEPRYLYEKVFKH